MINEPCVTNSDCVAVNVSSAPPHKNRLDIKQKKQWERDLECVSVYIDAYADQIGYGGEVHDSHPLFPYPMFELMPGTSNSACKSQILARGMSLNFHVLYAEAEILKILINS